MSTSPETDTAMNGVEDAEDTLTVQVETSGLGTTGASAPHPPNNADIPKPKRLACMICRKRKLRCDGNRPHCSTCMRLGHDCAYDEVRRKSGPKRGYVKALEERLKQVETLLKTQDQPAAPKQVVHVAAPPALNSDPKVNGSLSTPNNLTVHDPSISLTARGDLDRWNFNGDNSPQPRQPADTFDFNAIPMQNSFTWEMVGLGLEEPLPPQESIDEL